MSARGRLHRRVSVVAVVACLLVWATSIWSYYWPQVSAVVLSVSHVNQTVPAVTTREYRRFSHSPERHLDYTTIRYRFRSDAGDVVSDRIAFDRFRLDSSEPVPLFRTGETIAVYVPFIGARYSVVRPGISPATLWLLTGVVALFLALPLLADTLIKLIASMTTAPRAPERR